MFCKLCGHDERREHLEYVKTTETTRRFKRIVSEYTGQPPCFPCIISATRTEMSIDSYVVSKLFRTLYLDKLSDSQKRERRKDLGEKVSKNRDRDEVNRKSKERYQANPEKILIRQRLVRKLNKQRIEDEKEYNKNT